MAKGPRRINPTSVILVLLVVGVIYAGWKLGPVYLLGTKVETILDAAKYDAAEIEDFGFDPREDELLEDIRQQLLDLGLDDEKLDVYISDDQRRIHADYTVVIDHPFEQTTTLERSHSIEIPREN